MLQKSLKLVGLAVVLVLLSGSLSFAAAVQQDATLDPGLVDADDASQQALVAELLSQMIASGYDPRVFDFAQLVIDPLGRAIFVPVKLTDQVKEQIQEFSLNEGGLLLMGLLYVRQTTEINGTTYSKGLYPVFAENSAAAEEHPSKEAPSDARLMIRVGPGGDFEGGGSSVIVSGRICIRVDFAPFFAEICVGGRIF